LYKELVVEDEENEEQTEGGDREESGDGSAEDGTEGVEEEEEMPKREQSPMRLNITSMPQHHNKLPFQPPSPRLPSIGQKADSEPIEQPEEDVERKEEPHEANKPKLALNLPSTGQHHHHHHHHHHILSPRLPSSSGPVGENK
jgi:hypothetical protein